VNPPGEEYDPTRSARRVDAGVRPVGSSGARAALAVLTKGNGLFLALVPLLSLLLGRRWHVLRSRALWSATAAVLLVAGPWTAHFPGIVRVGWPPIGPSIVTLGTTLVVLASSLLRPTARRAAGSGRDLGKRCDREVSLHRRVLPGR
jgi:hypothetical protein